MMNGITYYRLKSDYPGDYTKNCALSGSEVDNNFYVLEGRDVKTVAVNEKDIVVTLMNGEEVVASGVLDFVKPEEVSGTIIGVEFDRKNGVLKITGKDGSEQTIEGFVTNENMHREVATDSTIWGNGLMESPICVAPSAKTGQYRPVKAIIDMAKGGCLPKCGNIIGDRYVTSEDISDYGYLYDYNAVRKIACELIGTGWRIPTKEDWDDLLNSVEPCKCDKEHEKADRNKYLGKWAGRMLKSKTMWKDECCGCDCECEKKCECVEDESKNTCIDYTDGECIGTSECEESVKFRKDCGENYGIDAYGFRITPAGYADDGCNFGYFKERSAFWTATVEQNCTKAYIKRFEYNKSNVYQDAIPCNNHLSLRLVKDYDGRNYFSGEKIMDLEYPTLLLPSDKHGKSIWTACNFACGCASLKPMLPNNGQGITFTHHFFINEWNGFAWVRNELKNGESVTVENSHKGRKMAEYRVVENHLVCVEGMVYHEVMEDVKPIIKHVEDKLTDRIDMLDAKIETEREERVTGDSQLWDGLNKEIERAKDVEAQLWNGIATEAAAREDVDRQIWEAIAKEAEARKEVDDQQWAAIENEGTIREEEDLKIWKALEKETEDRTDVDNQQWEAINTEREERKAKDTEIEGKLLTQEGTEFDSKTGELTLKSAAGTNDIKVQFTFDFGEF